ncbi:MAG: hypothetical protein WCE80_03870 [Acidimicrobiia bacterium]
MPTASELALEERDLWFDLAGRWSRRYSPEVWDDRPPTEAAVVVFFDPMPDLSRRASVWGHDLPGADLASLAAFASALADLEGDSWSSEKPDLATRAYETRRFLLGDRVIHWAVPWLDAVGRSYPAHHDAAHHDRDALLGLADVMRVAPELPGAEGLQVAGEDSFGPTEIVAGEAWVGSLWSGALTLDGMSEMGDSAEFYVAAATKWAELADRRPGSAQLWLDLAARARRTASAI